LVIVVTFIRDGQTLARLGVAYGQRVLTEGDCSWIDYGFSPVSTRLQRAVSFQEDAEEWARSLPEAYAGTPLQAQVIEDTGMNEILAVAANGVNADAPAMQDGTISHNLKISPLRQPRLMLLLAVLAVAALFLLLTRL